jgi:hypothetical protein
LQTLKTVNWSDFERSFEKDMKKKAVVAYFKVFLDSSGEDE